MPRISVGVRIRPDSVPLEKKLDGFNISTETSLIELSVSGTAHAFNFDNIFSDTASQEDVFIGSSLSIMDGVLDGYNGCIFAYGQTGAG